MRSIVLRARHPLARRSKQITVRFASSLSESAPRSTNKIPSAPCTRYTAVTHPEDPASVPRSVKAILSRSEAYILPVYARPPFVLDHGKGAYVWDTEDRRYLDFSAGIAVNALGHADLGVANVMASEASTLMHSSNVYHNQWGGRLAELLVTLTQREGGLGWERGSQHPVEGTTSGAKVFFSNSGTEANEGALKVARKLGKERWAGVTGRPWDDAACDKYEIVCFERGFHGRSMGALSVTTNAKYQKPFAPLLPGVRVGKLNELEGLDGLVTQKTCAVIVEPIQGEGGIHAADITWLQALRKKCNQVGAVLIYDEIQCGLYRTGSLWAHSRMPVDAHPDIVTMAKPLANGFPIGAVLMRDSVAETMTTGSHGTTFGGSPLACALGHYVLSRLSERLFVANVAEMSAYLQGRLHRLPEWFPSVLQPGVRGRGLILGLGFKDESHPGKLVAMARERGMLLLTAGKDAVRLVPSLNITQTEVDLAVDVMESCLHVLQSH
ncbi:acetylornithine and succinylornithine aminotransferase [Laetiporus sulphureus 93-53]|uniref:Acetylornithine and succinylornithine aminotransferase n=1 Tax=Laetiporus sulphureus 93-53 TaxID=1314785 RepID=A0A165IDB4_9APHY|nr:acetylornithine and succinylornithine aminotransferase [Laetiporus sulphureus 93-53]KZT12922.1 acetylornithine and succinylornithine aminotransferase [Laetiporus sulphureus 93-53]